MAKKKRVKLIPPDLKRCQAEMSNGWNFMTLGGRKEMVRCTNKPTAIVRELKPDKDGIKGSMSLCTECLAQFMMRVCPTAETHAFEEIKR